MAIQTKIKIKKIQELIQLLILLFWIIYSFFESILFLNVIIEQMKLLIICMNKTINDKKTLLDNIKKYIK